MALGEFPSVNASLVTDGQALQQHRAHNLGVAMTTPAGLVVPNVKAVQRRSLPELAHELARLQVMPMCMRWACTALDAHTLCSCSGRGMEHAAGCVRVMASSVLYCE